MPSVTQKQLGDALSVTSRQVRNLTDSGVFLRRHDGKSLVYDLGDCVQAYLRYKIEANAGIVGSAKDNILALQAKKLELEVAVAELALAQQRGQLLTLDYIESQVRGLLENLRARCLNLPGKYARELAEASDPAIALDILERAVAELLQDISEAGEDPDLDPDDDSPEGTDADGNPNGRERESGMAA